MVFNLLSHYFTDDIRYHSANRDIVNSLQNIILRSKKVFRISNLLKGIHLVDLKDKVGSVRAHFKTYIPTIKKNEIDENIQDSKTASDSEFMGMLYMSSLHFWSDIRELATLVDHKAPKGVKKDFIRKKLRKMNKNLPSFIFIPSTSKSSFPTSLSMNLCYQL